MKYVAICPKCEKFHVTEGVYKEYLCAHPGPVWCRATPTGIIAMEDSLVLERINCKLIPKTEFEKRRSQ